MDPTDEMRKHFEPDGLPARIDTLPVVRGREPLPCPSCHGSGQWDDCTACPMCDGTGESLF